MLGEARSIHFSTQLIYPPTIKLEEKESSIQELYYELTKVEGCRYKNVSINFPNPPQFFTKQGEIMSSCTFTADRVIIQEDWVDITLENFFQKIREILDRGFRLLNLGVIVIQVCVVRCLFVPHYSSDARVFLAEKACNLGGKVSPYFKRPAQMFGIRLLFPPLSKDMPYSFDVRIESFNRDTRQIFVETIGTFHLVQPISPVNIGVAIANMDTTYRFCTNDVKNFLNQFDIQEGGIQ